MRFLSSAERGDFFARLASWRGVAGPERLVLFQLVGAQRLMESRGRMLVDLTLEEIAQDIGRAPSSVRTSIGRLRDAGLLQRDDGGRSLFDLSPLGRAIGFEPNIVTDAELAGFTFRGQANSSGAAHLNPGASPASSRSHKYKYDSQTLEAEGPEIESPPVARIRELIDRMLQPEILPRLNRSQDLQRLFEGVKSRLGDGEWTPSAVRTATEHTIPEIFTSTATGPGLNLRIAKEGGRRFGPMLLLHAAQALLHGQQPKGLLIFMIKSNKTATRFTESCIEKALEAAAAALACDEAKQAISDREATKHEAGDVLRRVIDVVKSAPALSTTERNEALRAAKGYAEIRRFGDGKDGLLMALPDKRGAMLWKSLIERVSPELSNAELPNVVVCAGALAGGRIVRMSEVL